MTATQIVAAQSVGGTAGHVHEQKKTAEAGTTAYYFTAEVTAAAGLPNPAPRTFKLWYSSSPIDMTAAQAKTRLLHTARSVDLPIPHAGAGILIKDGTLEPTSTYLYVWFETEGFTNPVAVQLIVNEF